MAFDAMQCIGLMFSRSLGSGNKTNQLDGECNGHTPVSGEYYKIYRQDLGKTTPNPLKWPKKWP